MQTAFIIITSFCLKMFTYGLYVALIQLFVFKAPFIWFKM